LNFRSFLKEHLGITVDDVLSSENSNFFSQFEGYSGDNYKKMDELMDAIYDDFKAKVVAGRNKNEITSLNIENFAQGRIWTGLEARNLSLIDVVGGFTTAIDITKELLGLSEKDSIKLVEYPKKASLLKQILSENYKKSSRDDDKTNPISIIPNLTSTIPLEMIGFNFAKSMICSYLLQMIGVNLAYNQIQSLTEGPSIQLICPNNITGTLK